MRLPWLQVNEDGFTRARSLAALLGVSENEALGLVMRLWRWALEMAPAGDFSGAVPDAELLAASVGWPREKVSTLLTELQRVGLLATTPQLRVRGLDRYQRAWEKNQRKPSDSGPRVPESGTNPANVGAKPALTRAVPARKTETETEKKTHTKATTSSVAVAPDWQPYVDELCGIYLDTLGAKYAFNGRDAKAAKALLGLGERDEVFARWRLALARSRDKYQPDKVRTLSDLVTHWNVYPMAQLAEAANDAPF